MRFRKTSAELVEGETIKLTLDLSPAAGANSITAVDWVCSELTFATETFSGTTATAYVSGGTANRNYIVKITVTLSSNETKVGAIELEWKEPGYEFRAGAR